MSIIFFIIKRFYLLHTIFFLSISMLVFQVNAATFNVKVNMTVLQQTCDIVSINNINEPISINFDDVLAGKIDGKAYKKEIPFKIICTDSSYNPALKIKMTGDAGFNQNILGTNKTGLGIIFYLGNDIMNLGTLVNFDLTSRKSLFAAPIKNNNSSVTGGVFTSTSSLVIEYQ